MGEETIASTSASSQGESKEGIKKRPLRDRTDTSLRDERSKADEHFEDKFARLEKRSDEIVRATREDSAETLEAERNAADQENAKDGSSGISEAQQHARDQEDAALRHEQTTTDAVLDEERKQRRRYLAEFVSAERQSTDSDLTGERAHSDTEVEARDNLLATVSHDLRSLLGALSISTSMLHASAPDGESGDKMRKHANLSQRVIHKMDRLIGDLLDVATIEAGKLIVVPEDTDVGVIVEDTIDAFESIAMAMHITLKAELPQTHLRARMDAQRIQQVLANLVSNATKFTSQGGTIVVSVQGEPDQIHFAVSDTGIGIAASDLENVFHRFQQVTLDRRGLGLGLHISKGIVELHGGTIWAESEKGVGSTFHFVIPTA